MSNWRPQTTHIKAVAALVWAFCLSDAAAAGAETGVTNVAHTTTSDAGVVLDTAGHTGRFGGARGNQVLVTGPSSFWSNNATNATMRVGGLQMNRSVLRFLPGTTGDGIITPIVGNNGGITVTGKVLQVMAGFTNSSSSGRPVNVGLLRALGAGAEPDAAQAFTNVSMIVGSNASSGSIVAPRAGSAFSVGAVLIHASDGVIRVTRGGQSVLNGTVTNRAVGAVQSNSAPPLKFNQGVTNYGAIPTVGPSTAIHSGLLLLGPTGIISVPDTEPPVDPAR